MILAKLIEKITVDRGCNIHIYFFITGRIPAIRFHGHHSHFRSGKM